MKPTDDDALLRAGHTAILQGSGRLALGITDNQGETMNITEEGLKTLCLHTFFLAHKLLWTSNALVATLADLRTGCDGKEGLAPYPDCASRLERLARFCREELNDDFFTGLTLDIEQTIGVTLTEDMHETAAGNSSPQAFLKRG